MQPTKINVNNLEIYLIKTSKFKTILTGIIFFTKVDKKGMAERALLTQIMPKLNMKYPTEQSFSVYLQELYDMAVSSYPYRYGQVASFNLLVSSVNDKFLKDSNNLFQQAVEVLKTCLLEPSFDNEIIELEKKLIIQDLQSIYNNKAQYANHAFIKTMFKDESLSIPMSSTPEEIERITRETLIEEYQRMLRCQRAIYVIGDITEKEIEDAFQNWSLEDSIKDDLSFIDLETKAIEDINVVLEEQEINQSIVCMGYRSEIRLGDTSYNGMVFLNGMLGQFFHSTLFQEIREKRSLAYYVGCDYNPRKGNLAIVCAIDGKNYDTVVEVVKEIITNYQNGDVSDENLELTKKAIINQIIKAEDLPGSSINYIINEIAGHNSLSLDEQIERVNSIGKEDIVRAAQQLKLDTIFCLKGVL